MFVDCLVMDWVDVVRSIVRWFGERERGRIVVSGAAARIVNTCIDMISRLENLFTVF